MHKTKTPRKWGWREILQLVLVGVILVSGGMLAAELLQYRQGTDTYRQATDTYTAPKPTAAPAASAAGTAQPEAPGLGFDLLEVDFAALQGQNPDVVAWLDFDALDISYPVVQGDDDQEYLYTMWNGRDNKAGSIFLEAENTGWDDLHTIVYGHNMKNGSMFGQLKQYRDEAFYRENGGWYTLYLPDGSVRRYEIFGVKLVSQSADLYTIGFDFDDTYTRFLQKMCEDRLYPTGVTLYSEDRVMTLSTCTYSDEYRLVTCARLAQSYTPDQLAGQD